MVNIFQAVSAASKTKTQTIGSVVPAGGGWWPWTVKEPFSGAWQHNIEYTRETVLAHHAVFACVTLIASDIAKMRMGMVRWDKEKKIWVKIPSGKYSVISKPNNFQNSIQFYEKWMLSKLIRGNTYVLKGRDSKGDVVKLYILHPDLVTPQVTDTGEVYYQLGGDNLSGVAQSGIVVPASEIIHDRFNCIFHDLVGVSPLFAAGLAAYNGIKIQENSAKHFKNLSRPSGILTAPGAISDDIAARLKESWEANYGGENFGKTAVLGDDLKYQPITVTAVESQMVEQLKLNAETVCGVFHVPAYKVLGNAPSYDNIGALQQQYLDQCLQIHIESVESGLDNGLKLSDDLETRFDQEGLLRMDAKGQIDMLSTAVKGGVMPPNTALKKQNLPPQTGGDSVFMQQQMFSLAALAKRDAREDPFSNQTNAVETINVDDEEKSLMEFSLMLRNKLKENKHHA